MGVTVSIHSVLVIILLVLTNELHTIMEVSGQ